MKELNTSIPTLLRLQALAQTALAYDVSPYERRRCEEILEISAKLLSSLSGEPTAQIVARLEAEKGYATPKVGVRVAVTRGDSILFVREATDGKWCLPGGWADVGLPPSQAAQREVSEETGLAIKNLRLCAVFDSLCHSHDPVCPFQVYTLFFLAERAGGDLTPSKETTDLAFFNKSEIPELSTGRVTREQVLHMWHHIEQPGLPPYFD